MSGVSVRMSRGCYEKTAPAWTSWHSTAPTWTPTPTPTRQTRLKSLRPTHAISSRGSSRGCRCRCGRRGIPANPGLTQSINPARLQRGRLRDKAAIFTGAVDCRLPQCRTTDRPSPRPACMNVASSSRDARPLSCCCSTAHVSGMRDARRAVLSCGDWQLRCFA